MQIEARFRRRAVSGESLSELNDNLLDQMSSIAGLWAANRSCARFDVGTGESAATDLSSCLADGIKGAISYASRLPAAIADKAISDDFITLRFDTSRVNFQGFCSNIFPEIVRVFRPYRASVVSDLDLDLDDFEEVASEARRTGFDIDGRDSVYRLHPINYFDHEMCERAFGISPEQVAGSFGSQVVSSEVFLDGVMLVISNEPSSGVLLSDIATAVRRTAVRRIP